MLDYRRSFNKNLEFLDFYRKFLNILRFRSKSEANSPHIGTAKGIFFSVYECNESCDDEEIRKKFCKIELSLNFHSLMIKNPNFAIVKLHIYGFDVELWILFVKINFTKLWIRRVDSIWLMKLWYNFKGYLIPSKNTHTHTHIRLGIYGNGCFWSLSIVCMHL